MRLQLELDGKSHRFVTGLHNAGHYPGQNWVEVIDIDVPPALKGDAQWEVALAPYLAPVAHVLPPGAHMMIEYETEKWGATQRGLLAGIPPLATPLGQLLHRLDFGSSFKDWYFPEGGQEGSRKLQGNRALSPEHRAETAPKRAAELRAFLERPSLENKDLDARARAAAARLLSELERA